MTAAGAGPRLALLGGLIALEDALAVAAGAMGVFPVRGVAGPPQMLQAGGVVGELPQELGDRVVRGRGFRSLRFVAVGRRYGVKLLVKLHFVK